jgi:hypothetical protein
MAARTLAMVDIPSAYRIKERKKINLILNCLQQSNLKQTAE